MRTSATLCGSSSLLVQVTFEPTGITRSRGANTKSSIVMVYGPTSFAPGKQLCVPAPPEELSLTCTARTTCKTEFPTWLTRAPPRVGYS